MQREPAARQNMQQELREMGRALTVMNALLMRVRKALVHTNRRVVRGGARAGPSRAPSCSHLRRLFPGRGVPMSPVLARGWQHRGRRVPAVAAWCVRPPMSSIHLRKLRRRGLVAHGTGWRGTWRGSRCCFELRRGRGRPRRQLREGNCMPDYGRAPWPAYLGL